MTTNTGGRRIAVQAAAITVGATTASTLYTAVEHTSLLITGLLGGCIAGLLGCMATAIHVMHGTRPQPALTMRTLPAAPAPAAGLPAPTTRPALPTGASRPRPSPRKRRAIDNPAARAVTR